MHTLELAERRGVPGGWILTGGVPGGWILEIVARQPDLLSRAGKGAEDGNKPGVGRNDAAFHVMPLLGTPNPPSSWDSCKHISTQAQSRWFNVL